MRSKIEVTSKKEKVVGVKSKKRPPQSKKISNNIDLKHQISLLCRSDKGLKILSRILPALLMETDKAPIVFYLRTVLQSEITLGELIKMKELKVIEEILWELGGEENETDSDNFNVTAKSWLEAKSDNRAVQALKKGAIIMKQVNEKVESDSKRDETFQSLECLASLDLDDSNLECSEEAEKWIHKQFMMLLVKCVTIRWKRGKIKTKIRAVKCLRVLIRFLRSSDSPQYITQVLTMIDSVMNYKYNFSDPPNAESKLHLLAVKALSHFVYVLLSHKVEVVGENLCKIIVSIFPLFDTEAREGNKTDPYTDAAITQAVSMMEYLSEGENGTRLASYFNDVPFLPKKSAASTC